jgi:recombination protein RecT
MADIVKTTSVKSILESENVKGRLQEILGKNAATFATSVIQIAQTPALSKCEPASIVGAAMTAATLNLPINNMLGYSYIIPFGTKATYQIGVKGYVQLAQRSGQFKFLKTSDVKEGEMIHRNRLTGQIDWDWIQDDKERANKKTIGYVAFMSLINGYEDTHYMSLDEVQAHGKKYSQMYKRNSGLWVTEFDLMAEKTVLKLLLSKKAPLSTELQIAVRNDQAAVNDPENIEDISYLDNEELEPEVDHEAERQADVMTNLKTREDFDYAIGVVDKEDLVKELHLQIVAFVSDEESLIWAKEIVTDEVAKANLKLKEIKIKKELK